uniref:RNase H type-1 domain-containing protein n=1 Tax=Lactuca sativa TaxID=4236 RepID=A0A9R1WYR5_LACSA|nr:hypothetical protein LSAT_V11C800404620 [Lactuca sativa]
MEQQTRKVQAQAWSYKAPRLKKLLTHCDSISRHRTTRQSLRLAKEVGAKQLADLNDSLLVTNQINGTYGVKDPRMQKYLDAVHNISSTFKCFPIKQISQGKNARADALRKLASTSYDHLTKKVLVEELLERSIDNQKVNTISAPPEWTKPFVDYLCHGVLPDYP